MAPMLVSWDRGTIPRRRAHSPKGAIGGDTITITYINKKHFRFYIMPTQFTVIIA